MGEPLESSIVSFSIWLGNFLYFFWNCLSWFNASFEPWGILPSLSACTLPGARALDDDSDCGDGDENSGACDESAWSEDSKSASPELISSNFGLSFGLEFFGLGFFG
jgi:hypothetical protein